MPLATVALGVVLLVSILLALGSGEPPPATGAATLVPADALLYVHLSTDRSRPAVGRALALARRLPGLPVVGATLSGRLGAPLTAPWVGKEAAFALLNTTGSSAGSLVVLDVRRPAGARAFLSSAGAVPDGSYRHAALWREPSGTMLAFASHYLLLGQDASVRAALDVARGHGLSLAASSGYQQAAAGEPDNRVLDVYASVGGVRRVLEPRGGMIGALGTLLDKPSLNGVTASASAVAGGLRLRIHEALDPALAHVTGVAAQFTPTLAGVLPSRATMMLDMPDLARSGPRILAAAATAGVGAKIAPLLSRLGSALASQGVDVPALLSLFSGETALALVPGDGPPARGTALLIVSRTRHPAEARSLLAGLEAPLAQLFPPPGNGAGQAPEFNDVQAAGVTVHQFALAPGIQLDYAVFRGLVVLSTSARVVASVAHHARALADSRRYQATLADSPGRVTSLLFFDFNQLLGLGEQAGLMRGGQLATLRPDLQKVRAAGLYSTSGESDTTSELFLQIP